MFGVTGTLFSVVERLKNDGKVGMTVVITFDSSPHDMELTDGTT